MHYNQCERDQIHYFSKMLTQISGVIFPHRIKEKTFVLMYVEVQTPCSPTLSLYIFISVDT